MPDTKKQGNVSDHLANERTLLAWVRTSIGIMDLGFVVVNSCKKKVQFFLQALMLYLVRGCENAILKKPPLVG